jgi:hypothetical protein
MNKKEWNHKQILILQRIYGSEGTNGTLTYQGRHICHTIELPDKDNKPRESCIPEGRYGLKPYHSKRFPNSIGVAKVPRRSAILFHAANNAMEELLGCIAPVTTLTGEGKGIQSGHAVAELKALVHCLWDQGLEVELVIRV